jgi:hypothetical protein
VEHVVEFDEYTDPMKRLLSEFVNRPETAHVVSSAHPRLVDGTPSKNPRYLQRRADDVNARGTYLAEICVRLDRAIPVGQPVHFPVSAVLAGRRGNPADLSIGLLPLAVYSPIHYQELPEMFMDVISSLTGKSPSTTGFGSEGALTKGPFNAVWPVVDLNNALVSAILTEYAGFTTAAGYVGPYYRVDHDISMLVPEVWCRMQVHERDPRFLIENRFLEKLADFDWKGRRVAASRLGYRITERFADRFLGRIFEAPDTVFPEEMLRPEKQDMEAFAAGVQAIVETQRQVAASYFEDGSINGACPPLRALLHIMACSHWGGKTIDDPGVRAMFTREALFASDWYRERLRTKQQRDIALWNRHIAALEGCYAGGVLPEREIEARLVAARAQLLRVSATGYIEELEGTIGADPFIAQEPSATG